MLFCCCCYLVTKSCPTQYGLQHTRLLCPPPSPGVCANSCPLSQRCYLTISSSVIPFSSCLLSFPAAVSFSSELTLPIRWQKYWSFSSSISPSNEYSGLISFRIDWFDLLAVQETLKSLLQHHSLKASILWHSAFFMVQLSHLYMTIGNAMTPILQTRKLRPERGHVLQKSLIQKPSELQGPEPTLLDCSPPFHLTFPLFSFPTGGCD